MSVKDASPAFAGQQQMVRNDWGSMLGHLTNKAILAGELDNTWGEEVRIQ